MPRVLVTRRVEGVTLDEGVIVEVAGPVTESVQRLLLDGAATLLFEGVNDPARPDVRGPQRGDD